MNNYEVLSAIDNIETVTMEAEMNVLMSLGNLYAKQCMIMEYASPEACEEIFQEDGFWRDVADETKNMGDNQNKFVKALTLIFRFIIALAKQISKRIKSLFKKKPEEVAKKCEESVKSLVKSTDETTLVKINTTLTGDVKSTDETTLVKINTTLTGDVKSTFSDSEIQQLTGDVKSTFSDSEIQQLMSEYTSQPHVMKYNMITNEISIKFDIIERNKWACSMTDMYSKLIDVDLNDIDRVLNIMNNAVNNITMYNKFVKPMEYGEFDDRFTGYYMNLKKLDYMTRKFVDKQERHARVLPGPRDKGVINLSNADVSAKIQQIQKCTKVFQQTVIQHSNDIYDLIKDMAAFNTLIIKIRKLLSNASKDTQRKFKDIGITANENPNIE